jgi:hypothetical protein
LLVILISSGIAFWNIVRVEATSLRNLPETLPADEDPRGGAAIWDASILRPNQETKPVNSSAHGVVGFYVYQDNRTIGYLINASNIENVTGIHIRHGMTGSDGPIVATLFDADSPPGKINGVFSIGNITSVDLVGDMENKTMEDFFSAIDNGELYVNVHTIEYPEGEIRGQIQEVPM